MTTDNAAAVVQDFFQKCFRGLISSAVELLDPRVTYRVPGSHQLAGTFVGPLAVAQHVEKFLQVTDHTVDVLKWEDWMVGVNNIAALVNMRARRHGTIDTIRAIYLVTMSNEGKIERIEVFFSNQAEVDRFLH